MRFSLILLLLFLFHLHRGQSRDAPYAIPTSFNDKRVTPSTFVSENIAIITTISLDKWYAAQTVTFRFKVLDPNARDLNIIKFKLTTTHNRALIILKMPAHYITLSALQHIRPIRDAFEHPNFVYFRDDYTFFCEYFVLKGENVNITFAIERKNITIVCDENGHYYAVGIQSGYSLIGVPVIAQNKLNTIIEKLFGIITSVPDNNRAGITTVDDAYIKDIVNSDFENDQIINPRFIVPIIWSKITNETLPSIFIHHRIALSIYPKTEVTSGERVIFKFSVFHSTIASPEIKLSKLGLFDINGTLVIVLPTYIEQTKLINPIIINQQEANIKVQLYNQNGIGIYLCGIRDNAKSMFVLCEWTEKFDENDGVVVSSSATVEDIGSAVVFFKSHAVSLVGITLELLDSKKLNAGRIYYKHFHDIICATTSKIQPNDDIELRILKDFFTQLQQTISILIIEAENVEDMKKYLKKLADEMIPGTNLYSQIKNMIQHLNDILPRNDVNLLIDSELLQKMKITLEYIKHYLFN